MQPEYEMVGDDKIIGSTPWADAEGDVERYQVLTIRDGKIVDMLGLPDTPRSRTLRATTLCLADQDPRQGTAHRELVAAASRQSVVTALAPDETTGFEALQSDMKRAVPHTSRKSSRIWMPSNE